MPRLDIREAALLAEEDQAMWCKSCSNISEEGSEFCWVCKSYWDDVDAGLFSENQEPINGH